MSPEQLQEALAPYVVPWPVTTRLHQANAYFPEDCWIKREDEHSGGIIGTKYRKFTGLVAYWRRAGIRHLLIWGSASSNNVMGLVQLANEEGLTYTLCLLANQHPPAFTGNHLWLQLLARPGAAVHYIDRETWHTYQLPQPLKQASHLTIPEGAQMPAALPGCLLLAKELMDQEAAYGVSFSHIFIDSGKGLTAIGLLLGLALLGNTDKSVHITLMAGSEAALRNELARFQKVLPDYQLSADELAFPLFYCYSPPTARSFGAVNRTILQQVRAFARMEGILTDPIYGAKHACSAARIMADHKLEGAKLFIHNGGGLSVSGFQDKLTPLATQPE